MTALRWSSRTIVWTFSKASIHCRCPGCGWPLCNSKCSGIKKSIGHSTWECSLLRERRVADLLDRCKTEKDYIDMYEVIAPLRCLLLKQNSKDRWEKLQRMESHNGIRRGIPSLWQRNQRVIVEQIRNRWGIKDFTEEEIHTVCGILEVNCFEIGQNESRARALYDEAYLLAHDCTPNTTHTDDPYSYELFIRVLGSVSAGVPLTLTYAYTLQGTLKRRQHLNEGKFFWCRCARCTDPTEFATYSSALICPKCNNDGLILSTNPLSETATWQCNNCSYVVTGQSMLRLVDTVFRELDDIDSNNAEGFEEFLSKYRNVLHKNHYLCICAKHSLCQLYGRSEGYLIQELSLELLQRKEQYCRDLLEVIDRIEPGLSRLRGLWRLSFPKKNRSIQGFSFWTGLIMYELHAPIMIQATRLFESKKITSDDLRKRLREVVKLLKESQRILSMEPEESSEHSMALAAADALKRIGRIWWLWRRMSCDWVWKMK